MAKLSEHRRAQLREAQKKYRENRIKNKGEKFVQMWVKDTDPKQINLIGENNQTNETIEQIKALISKEREKNLYTERNKSLLTFIQKLEEILTRDSTIEEAKAKAIEEAPWLTNYIKQL